MPAASLFDSLQAVRRKVRVLAVANGIGVTLSAAIGLLVAVVLADWLLGLDKTSRIIALSAAGISFLYVLWHWLITPIRAKLNLGDVAGRLEHTYPQFDDRLRSTINFSSSEIPGSRAMQSQVVSEANAIAANLDLQRVLVRRPVYLTILVAVLSLATLATLMEWGRRSGWLSIAANRLLLGPAMWPKSVEIAVDGQIPPRVPVGQRVPVKIHLAKGDKISRKAIIYYRYDGGPWQQELMSRKDDGAYTAMLDAKLDQGRSNAQLETKIEAGDDEVTLAPIAVVPRLEISRVEARVTPPPYVKPSIESTVNLNERPASLAYGSAVTLDFAFNKALKDGAAVELRSSKEGAKLPDMKWDRTNPSVARAQFNAQQSFRFSVKATDADSFQNAGGEEFEVIVKADQPPTVQIEEPKRSEDRTPNAAFSLKAVAEDDYGVVGAQLVVDRIVSAAPPASDKPDAPQKPQSGANHWVLDLVKDGIVANTESSWDPADSSPDRKRYHLGYQWDLEKFAPANLKPGDVLEYYVQVKDNFLLDGKDHPWVPSGKLRITIISLEQYMNQKQAQIEQIAGLIKAEHIAQNRQKTETDLLKQGVERNKKFDEADRAQTGRLANDQANTQQQTNQLAERLKNMVAEMKENKAPEAGLRQAADQVQDQLRQAAEGAMRDAKKNLDAAKDPSGDQTNKNDSKSPSDANSDQKSSDQKNQKSSDSKSPSGKPSDPKDSAAKPDNQGKPNDNNSNESKPGDPKSNDSKSSEAKSGQNSQNKDAKASKDAGERAMAMAKASESQKSAADQLQKALDKLGQMDGLAAAIDRMQRLKDEQDKLAKEFNEKNKDNVGKNANELSKDDQERNKKMAAEQRSQSQRMDDAVKQMEKRGDQTAKTDPSTSQAMKQAAQVAKSSNVSAKQQQSAQNMEQNKTGDQAQQNQKQIDIGIDQIINTLKEAQRKQLEELARQLAQMQQLVAELIRRQSGHNIDDLTLQKIWDKTDTKLRDDLLEMAQRDPKDAAPEVPLTQLTPAQEQTHTNTTDVARQAEALPDPAPAAKLTQAAGHMERAVVHLREAKLAEAYKPPMADALNSLLDAKKDVDKAAAKAQQDIQDEDTDTIKRMYVKLLDEQKKVGVDLRDIDKATVDNNGEVPRKQAVKLGKLPGDQGKLVDEAGKIGEKLKQLDSVVYTWANDDIIHSMNKVKDNLAKPDTSKPTQVAERDVEDQLTRMIESLVQKLQESKFANRNGGGGGGQGQQQKPKLPSEAELRLLKKNQESVQVRTVDADKLKEKKDKDEVAQISERQKDLRGVLDKLVKKASGGKQSLGPPPEEGEKLPEETAKESVDNQEIQDDLLGDKVTDKTVDKGIRLTGDRMYRSGARLAKLDTGKVTQEIQKRIVLDIDNLIKMAQQQSQAKPKPGSGKPQKANSPQPKPGEAQATGNKPNQQKPGGQNAAQDSQASAQPVNIDPNANVKEAMSEWGRITSRERQAVQEGASDEVVQKYRKLIEDYYRSLAEQANKR